MTTMSNADLRAEAHAYAATLRDDRGYVDVRVFRFTTAMDNRPQEHRNHVEAYGYAVRYTSGPADDHLRSKDGRNAPFHDRSLTIFCDDATGIPQGNLIGSGAVLADVAGEDAVTPYWLAAWSPDLATLSPEQLAVQSTTVPTVIMKRHHGHAAGDHYPWHIGPQRTYHLIMEPAS